MGLSPGPRALLSRAGSQCLKHWERWFRPGRRRVAVHVQSIRHARDDPGLSGSWKSRGFRRQCKGLCQTRALFAGSRPARSQLIVLFFLAENRIWSPVKFKIKLFTLDYAQTATKQI